ncbi:phage tail tip domain-containing protein, partial [Escherichia coli]|uniref:phage tail tip domain-containing protein n=1 Tax=Escherichia coli TaxID=562 RepID=UPI0040445DD3
ITRLSSSEPASDTSLAAAPAQQNKSTIVRLRSFVCIADDAPEKRVNMSSPEYYGVIDMPAGHGHMTLEFSVSAWLVNNWYPTASISDLLVVVMKKATAGITIS